MNAPFAYLRGNVINGLNLLEACVAGGVERFILSSTANLFGAPTSTVVDEQAPIAPGSPYGESKSALDWLSQTKGLRFASLLYFNAAWASEIRGEHHTPETHLIPLVLQVAAGHRDHITIFGDDYDTPDGTCIRDYLGNGEGFIVRQVIEAARVVTGAAISAPVDQRRAEDPARLVASSDRIRQELGWAPRFPQLEQIIDSAWRWHQLHPGGYID